MYSLYSLSTRTCKITYFLLSNTSNVSYLMLKRVKGKGKGAHEQRAQMAGAYHGFISMKHLGVLLLPPGRDVSPSQGYHPAVCRWYPYIHLGEERQSGVNSLV